ncbi:biopolymer transporter ExbD [Ostreiculturibacter nitratireducens]|uniref:ExbD/TolR family protein n=1 Tax=Ostreiculturibacter nitratireducens TaxID=3075226 RepID=UPI0031B5E272
MKLARRDTRRHLISLVPMIDVMLILLIFFMVTSTYLNLDMIPVVDTAEAIEAPANADMPRETTTLFVRIAADGGIFLRGQAVSPADLTEQVRTSVDQNPLLSIVVFPSSRATAQQLVSAMDMLTLAGATRLRLVQLEAVE